MAYLGKLSKKDFIKEVSGWDEKKLRHKAGWGKVVIGIMKMNPGDPVAVAARRKMEWQVAVIEREMRSRGLEPDTEAKLSVKVEAPQDGGPPPQVVKCKTLELPVFQLRTGGTNG